MAVRNLDFSTLTLRDALDLAILIEDEAEERYKEFASQMDLHHTPEAARFFRFMAENEAKHGADLSERRRELFQNAPSTVTRNMLWDVEAPEYDEARAFMSARAAMQSALRSEEKAHAFFVDVLPHLKDPDVIALFTELRDEEIHHQALVQEQLDKLPPDSDVNPEDFVDEPVGH